jgi:hypothetical protein
MLKFNIRKCSTEWKETVGIKQNEKRSLILIYTTFVNKVENYHNSFTAPTHSSDKFSRPLMFLSSMRVIVLPFEDFFFFCKINCKHFLADFEQKGEEKKTLDVKKKKSFHVQTSINFSFSLYRSSLFLSPPLDGIEKRRKTFNVVNHFVEKKYRRIIKSQKYF